MIQLHRLEGFYWVARTGGYARAARAFPYPITQPAVHQQVKKLEAELGVALFERVAKDRVRTTPAGARLYAFCRPLFEELPGLLRSLRDGEYGGEIRVRVPSLLLRHLMPAWIQRLARRAPAVQVHMEESRTADLAPLATGEADLVVDYLPEVPESVATLRVATVRPFLVLPRGHALARRARIPLAELGGETFVSYTPDSVPHRLQLQALARHGLVPARTLSASTAETILGFVEAGLGWSLVPSLAPKGPRVAGVAVRPLETPKVEFAIHAAWRKDTPENPLLDALLETAPRP
jgi:LysR family transcriptional regulator, benzoate and cis,cis-muconate-responsive activator of ben and cat genes